MPEHRYVQQAGEMGTRMEKGKDGPLKPNCHDSCWAATKTRESHDRFKGGHGKRCCPRQDTHPHRHTGRHTQIYPQDLIKPTGNVQRGVAASFRKKHFRPHFQFCMNMRVGPLGRHKNVGAESNL